MGEEDMSPKRSFVEYWTRYRRGNGKLTPLNFNYKLLIDDYGKEAADSFYNWMQYASRPPGVGEETLTDEQRKVLHESEEQIVKILGIHPKEILDAGKNARIENL